MREPNAVQPTLPLEGIPEPCSKHHWIGHGRWRACLGCWVRGWFK